MEKHKVMYQRVINIFIEVKALLITQNLKF